MEIKKGATFLMFKINTPNGIDFLKEHKKILDANGEVWLCRFGKTNVVLSKITADGNYVFGKRKVHSGELADSDEMPAWADAALRSEDVQYY